MNLAELEGGEDNPIYRAVEAENSERYYHFLLTLINVALSTQSPQLSDWRVQAINYQAVVLLHPTAGQYRTTNVVVSDAQGGVHYHPPPHELVPDLMSEFICQVNDAWTDWSELHLAAYALWRINSIHPFVNGNGRTARAVCYLTLCLKAGGLLPGRPFLPELLGGPYHQDYVQALKWADKGDLIPLMSLTGQLVRLQIGP